MDIIGRFRENVVFSQRFVHFPLILVDNSDMEPLRKDNIDRARRIHILDTPHAGRWNSITHPSVSDHYPIRLSHAHRHLEGSSAGPCLQSEGGGSSSSNRVVSSSLRHLTAFLHRIERENGSVENALSEMTRLGRETTGLLGALRDHFTNAPATVGIFDYDFVNRTNLADVDQWVRNHLQPLAEKRQRVLTTDFDTRLATLPANPIFGLIIEHLRKRIYDSSPHSSLGLAVHLIHNNVLIEITETGHKLPPTPISDESTRLLWVRVVNLLKGTIVWRGSPDYSETTITENNKLRITYPLTRSFSAERTLTSTVLHPTNFDTQSSAA